MSDLAGGLAGLVFDYGGVLTNALQDTLSSWHESDGIDSADVERALKQWLGSSYADDAHVNPVHALERGEIEIPHFEAELAKRLKTRDGREVEAQGLLTRMFAGFRSEPLMHDVLLKARAAGIATALLSNSWGLDYPREGWDELFDVVVISGEVGMRKPEPGIYLRVAADLGLPPERCVMVDDLTPNVRGAVAVGMVGVHHTDPEQTIAELEALFGVQLR